MRRFSASWKSNVSSISIQFLRSSCFSPIWNSFDVPS
jgi:hypothetical protein